MSDKYNIKNICGLNGSISINGKEYTGKNISVINNQVFVDGKAASEKDDENSLNHDITIIIQNSTVESIEINGNTSIKGNISGSLISKGSVNCTTIAGDVKAQGSVNCTNIQGNAKAGGSINCDNIHGNAKAGGSINY